MQTTYTEFEILNTDILEKVRAQVPDKFWPLLYYFWDNTSTYVTKMEDAMQRKNPVALVPPAHITKSASRQFGMQRLGEICATIESAAREALNHDSKDVSMLAGPVRQLRDIFEQTKREFDQRVVAVA